MNGYPAIITAIKFLHGRGLDVSPYLEKMAEIVGERSPLNDVFNHDYKNKGLAFRLNFVTGHGCKQPIKSRDNREPKLLEKTRLEHWLQELFKRRLQAQLEALRNEYKIAKPKKLPPIPDEKGFFSELISAILVGVADGISLFSETISIGIDLDAPNERAAKWAEEYAFDLIKDIDETSLEVVRRAIGGFVGEGGYTIGDIIDLIQPYFGDVRASMIAVTETTRAFAQGQLMAAEELKKEFPEFKIYKTWFTNNDDRVCDICGPLEGVEIPMDESFYGGEEAPPAHVNCRCWIEYNTKIE